jgi:EpsI family protein
MLNREMILVPAFLVVQAALVQFASRGEHPPAAPDLSAFPANIGGWEKLREDPIEPDVAAQLGADRLLNRTYVRGTSAVGNLFVAWFQSQRGGTSQPHSPQVCLPGAGWTTQAATQLAIDVGAGTISVNRMNIGKGQVRAVVLYWYQTPRRAIASEWAAKFWVVVDGLRDKRTDTSLVRIVVWNTGESDDSTAANAVELARAAYPWVEQALSPAYLSAARIIPPRLTR